MGHSQTIDFAIAVDGSPVEDVVRQAVIQITVDDTLDAAAVAMIKLRDQDGAIGDGPHFGLGAEVTIELGYVGAGVKEVFKGEVTGWRGAFPRRGGRTLTVVAQDKFHRLRRNRRQKTFLNMKDSAAVEQAVSAAGLTAEVEATPVTQDAISQWNLTDADFILQRASALGYEVCFDGGKVKFRKPKLSDAAVATLEWHKELKSFNVALSLADQQKDLKVSAWDPIQKAPIEKVVAKGQERSMMGGTVQGAKAAEDFQAGTTWLPKVDSAVTQAHVDAFAEGIYARKAERFVLGEGSCEGDPEVRRGTVVELEGIGNYLSGPYYVIRAIHTMLIGSGYTTTFRVKRTAVKAPAAPPQKQETQPEQERKEPTALLDPDWVPPGGIVAEVLVLPSGIRTESATTSPSVQPAVDGDDPELGPEAPPTTQTIRFKLEDQDGTPLGGKPFELVIPGVPPISGTTGADGYVVADVPIDAQTGELTFWLEDDKSGESYTWPLRIADHTA
ncbi:MAG: phage late control D family protein [Planctomycetes bacterium]|nr:phage late control D family protein [Planctomycetota bacterium]